MPPTGVILVIGAGPRIGKSIANKFASNGYKVALAARSAQDGFSDQGYFYIRADLSEPGNVSVIFEKVEQALGLPPNVVVFNGANRLTTPPGDPLAASLEDVKNSRAVGFDSAYIAAQEALKGFRRLPSQAQSAFIYTGNTLNQIAIPGVLPFAVGKVAAAMLVEYAANAYGKEGYRFYYADQRFPDGRPVGLQIDGEAHADLYWTLAHESKQTRWLVTFVKNEGRREFAGVDFEGNSRQSYDEQFGR